MEKRKDGNDTRALVHELQVHQVELEMQNEELRASQRARAIAAGFDRVLTKPLELDKLTTLLASL